MTLAAAELRVTSSGGGDCVGSLTMSFWRALRIVVCDESCQNSVKLHYIAEITYYIAAGLVDDRAEE